MTTYDAKETTLIPNAHQIKETIESKSTYAFEAKIMDVLNSAGYHCTHSGTYEDTITGKLREYDIQGQKSSETARRAFSHHIAVECKLLDSGNPLLVLGSTGSNTKFWHSPVYSPGGNHTNLISCYYPNEFVGRSMEQMFQKNKRKVEPASQNEK